MLVGTVVSVISVLCCVYGILNPIIIATILFAVCIWFGFRRGKWLVLILPLFLSLVSVISFVGIDNRQSRIERAVCVTDTVTFTVIEEPYLYYGVTNFKAKINKSNVLPNDCVVLIKTETPFLSMGDIVNTAVNIDSVSVGKKSLYYLSEDISAVVSDVGKCEKIGFSAFYSAIGSVRRYIKKTLTSNLKTPQASTLSALLIGERSDFTERFQVAVRQSGLSHVMVVSGMHLAIIIGGITALFRRIGMKRIWQNILFVTAIFLFMALCGFAISVQRAAVTYVLAVIATVINRDNDSVNTLSATVGIIMAFSPYVLFSISFQLSVLATFGIIVILPLAQKRLNRFIPNVKVLRAGCDAFIGSVAAMLATLPVIILNFGSVSLVAPLSNLLVSYAVTIDVLITALALVVNLVLPFDFIVKPLFCASGIVTKYINYVIYSLGSDSVVVNIDRSFAFVTVILIFALLLVRRIISRNQYYSQLKKIKEG